MSPVTLKHSILRGSRGPVALAQRGVSLIIALILLSLLALLVLGSFNLSSSNLLAVGNMQRRDEAAAAAAQLLEAAIAVQLKTVSNVFQVPQADSNSNINGFQVTLDQPRCIEWVSTSGASPVSVGTSVTLGPGFSATVSYDTLWEFKATATDSSGLGARVTMVQGVRAILTQAQKDTYCP